MSDCILTSTERVGECLNRLTDNFWYMTGDKPVAIYMGQAEHRQFKEFCEMYLHMLHGPDPSKARLTDTFNGIPVVEVLLPSYLALGGKDGVVVP